MSYVLDRVADFNGVELWEWQVIFVPTILMFLPQTFVLRTQYHARSWYCIIELAQIVVSYASSSNIICIICYFSTYDDSIEERTEKKNNNKNHIGLRRTFVENVTNWYSRNYKSCEFKLIDRNSHGDATETKMMQQFVCSHFGPRNSIQADINWKHALDTHTGSIK